MMCAGPVLVLSPNIKRENGRSVQIENIEAGKTVADVIRTCLGPQAMLKMLMDPMGGVVMTNDGNAILREITVRHPAAKTLIEVARTQDEEVGDGTTSVIVLAGEILSRTRPFLDNQMHPTVILRALRRVLTDITKVLPTLGKPIDVKDRPKVIEVIKTCIGTKFIGGWSDMVCGIAIDAVSTVKNNKKGHQTIDIKNFARIEKIPGGIIEDSVVLEGVMINKDITHPKMSRCIKNPKVLLLDCPLEYKKGESQTNIEMSDEKDFTRMLQIEEEYIDKVCSTIIKLKPDVVCTEKGICDLALHHFVRAGITALRRVRKTDNSRIALAVGATVVGRVDEIKPEDIGTGAGLFEVKKIGDEYFSFFTGCEGPKACTILLRGPSKDILKEAERNLQDALNIVRNIYLNPVVLPGAGAVEMALSEALKNKVAEDSNIETWEPYIAAAESLKVIPRTLIQNSGGTVVRILSALEMFHSRGQMYGIDGTRAKLVKSEELGIWEPILVKLQVYKSAIESAMLLLKIDGIVSGAKNKDNEAPAHQPSGKKMEESLKE